MLSQLLKASAFLALLAAAVCVRSQDSPPPASSAVPSPASGASATTPKKVWTNENLGGKGGVSVVGDKRDQNYHMTSNGPADPATVARIKKNLERLQTQLDDVNAKLKSYKEFQSGEAVSTGARDLSKGYSRTPVDQQITQLEQKKKQLENEVGDLVDEARKKGIDPGQLR
ncbi:MAG TPA: hypothetical protein VMH20_06910 [Verrucomicrobiae bacterium]|nr:hypothetical protein [Verrucomicrobiae bacterium]